MKTLKKLLLILAGNFIYSIAVAWFLLPSGLITGGTTGIALFINHYFSIHISAFVLIFNIIMFLLGLWILGWKFALSTIVSSVCYPFFLEVNQLLQTHVGILSEDIMINTIFSGLLIGIGIGLVIRAGASTGGMDIPPLILKKKFGISVSVSMYAFDFAILILQMLFSDRNQILYGILLVCIYTVVLDKVLIRGKSKIQLQIISPKFKEINNMISEKYDRGTTLYEIEGGYTRNEGYAVYTVIAQRELFSIQEDVTAIDPEAFIVISQVNEVKGRGFTLNKYYKK